MRERWNSANIAVEEADTDIRAGEEAERAGRDRAEAEARDWAEADIREEAERIRQEAGANTKAETD